MKAIDLNGEWYLRAADSNEWIRAEVPGTVYGAMLAAGKVEDPYYGDNELAAKTFLDGDFIYSRKFTAEEDILKQDKVFLCARGLDTLATIWINGRQIASTDNMHRTYCFDVKNFLVTGENTIQINFASPVAYAAEQAAQYGRQKILGGAGTEFLRKAICMFGWDWGISLPDMGIWRDISIDTYSHGCIRDIQIFQEHSDEEVLLTVCVDCDLWDRADSALSLEVLDPDGMTIWSCLTNEIVNGPNTFSATVSAPRLWWPNGYGEHPLYSVKASLLHAGKELDKRELNIGLRTLRLRRQKDKYGTCYEFVINGRTIFVKGSNLVIDDALLGRRSKQRTEQIIKNCVESNLNCIRVWGGAYYPEDYFFDLCDRYGLICCHDFMFACRAYPVHEEYIDTVCAEISDNVKRTRHHACIALWVGNNEIESILAVLISDDPNCAASREALGLPGIEPSQRKQLAEEYEKLFKDILPKLLIKLDPQRNYIHSSPFNQKETLFGSNYMSDVHYYVAYDNATPYRNIRNKEFRFVSEMGFQSYPDLKTIQSFASTEQQKPYSKVMLAHQKCNMGNQVIERYMSQDYNVPTDFPLYVYASQILAGEVLQYAVEYFRQKCELTKGVILWQLNDCWPAVTWSGIDYFGRWKAQQYYTKRFYAPILLSSYVEGRTVSIYVSNDRLNAVTGSVKWQLRDNLSRIMETGEKQVFVAPGESITAFVLTFPEKAFSAEKDYIDLTFVTEGKTVSRSTAMFVRPKEFCFVDPQITLEVSEHDKHYEILVSSVAFAKSVELYLHEADCIFSDNFFDLSADEPRIIIVEKETLTKKLTKSDFVQRLRTRSVYNLQQA